MRSKLLIVFGVLMLVLGTTALIPGELISHKGKIKAEVGPVVVPADTKMALPITPVLGGIGVVCGAALIVVRARKSTSKEDERRAGLLGLREIYLTNRIEELKEFRP